MQTDECIWVLWGQWRVQLKVLKCRVQVTSRLDRIFGQPCRVMVTLVHMQAVVRFKFSALSVGFASLSFSASSAELGGTGDALEVQLEVLGE